MDLSKLDLKPHKLFHHLDEVLKWKNGEYFPPIYVELSPTDICNQKCHFCYTDYMGHKKLEIEAELLIRIFAQLGHAGVKSVQIQGTGEPLLNKALPEAIIAGKKAGLDMALCSNGVLLKPEVSEQILHLLSWVRISAIEANPKLYSRTHGVDESHWHSVVKNLESAVKILGKDRGETVIATHFVAFDYNLPYVYDAVKLCKNIGLDYIQIKPAFISLHNPEHQWDPNNYLKFKDVLDKAKELQDDNFLVDVRMDQFQTQKAECAFPKDFEACYGMEFEIMIDSDACIYPCLNFWRDKEYSLGDLSKNSFEEIWKGKERQKVLNRIYETYDLNKCHFGCKHRHINSTLWKLANPPMHVNFL